MFRDLDLVFFCGRLSGVVALRWLPFLPGAYGMTMSEPVVSLGIASIQLSAEMIILDSRNIPERLVMMFQTMLHEICV